jgi:tetratricopeptide (TPR) repeat protein
LTRLALIASTLFALTAQAGSAADEHLLAGARHFRAGQFDEALVEFKVARKLAAGTEAGWYVAATLVKLERAEEALEAFWEAETEAPAAGDALLRYYQALACYQARMYLCADRLLAGVGERSGPRIGEQAARIRAQIAELFKKEPSTSSIDWYLERGRGARKEKRLAAATAYFQEAEGLSRRRRDCHRCEEAAAAVAQLGAQGPGKQRMQ